MRKIFLPSVPTRFDSLSERLVPSVNINPAAKLGRLVLLNDLGDHLKLTVDDMKENIRHALQFENMEKTDALVAIGDPILIGIAMHYACKKNGSVKVLTWDKHSESYHETEVTLE